VCVCRCQIINAHAFCYISKTGISHQEIETIISVQRKIDFKNANRQCVLLFYIITIRLNQEMVNDLMFNISYKYSKIWHLKSIILAVSVCFISFVFLTISDDCFLLQQQRIFLCNVEETSFLRGRNWIIFLDLD
jgi:hypothetical protein